MLLKTVCMIECKVVTVHKYFKVLTYIGFFLLTNDINVSRSTELGLCFNESGSCSVLKIRLSSGT